VNLVRGGLRTTFRDTKLYGRISAVTKLPFCTIGANLRPRISSDTISDALLRKIVVPLASVEDARTTCERVRARLDDGGEVLAVHVIEKAGGAPDKASVEQREQRTRDIFAVAEEKLDGEGIDLETETLYGTDVVETILDAASEFDATAIVFTPRGGSRWLKLLTSDTATRLVEDTDRPVVVLPADEAGGGG